METRYFLDVRAGIANAMLLHPAKNNQRRPSPAKIHPKVIDTLDLHPRKSSNNDMYFHGGLYRRFHILLSSEKKKNRKFNIYD